MRTDAKIGFAIVGVLLAVLAVYAVVIPKRAHNTASSAGPTVKVAPEPGAASESTVVNVPPVDVEATHPAEPTVTRVPPDTGAHNGEHPPVAPVEPAGTAIRSGTPDALAGGLTPGSSFIDSTRPLTPLPIPEAEHADRTAPKPRRHGEDAGHAVTVAATHAYRVRPGQTLSSIAAEVYGNSQSWKQIAKANPTVNPAKLKVGTKLMLPDVSSVHPHPTVVVPTLTDVVPDEPATLAAAGGPTVYRVQSGDSLYKIARRKLGSGRRADELYELNRDAIGPNPTKLRLGMVLRLPTGSDAVLLSDVSR